MRSFEVISCKQTSLAKIQIIKRRKYDVLGRRVLKETWSGTVKFTYSGENAVEEANITGSGVLKKSYLNGLGTDNVIAYDIDEEVLDGSGVVISTPTNRYFLQKDHLGSVVWLTDSGGIVVASYEYDSFGKAYVSGNSHGNTRLFTGREWDEETGLYYMRARYYDPVIGRFVNRDPIGQVDDINLYIYARNNPLRFTDPRGLYIKQMYADSKNGWADYYDYIQQQKQSENYMDFASAYVADVLVGSTYNLAGNWDKMSWDQLLLEGSNLLPSGKTMKWGTIVMKYSKEEIAKIAQQVTKKYDLLKCESCAKELKKTLDKAGIESEILNIKSREKFVYSDKFWPVSENNMHYWVKVGDTVYDNLHKQWLSYDDYIKDFGVGTWGSDFIKKP